MTTYVNSVQHVSITIPINQASATATISAVGANAFIIFNGFSGAATSNTSLAYTKCTLTNSTTVTATRNTSSATLTCTVDCVVVDATSSLVNSVQFGTVAIAVASATGTATVTSVNSSYYALLHLGLTSSQTSLSYSSAQSILTIAGTTVTATRQSTGSNSVDVNFCLIEFNSSACQQAVQNFQVAWTNSSTSTTQAITSVNTANTLLFHSGSSGNSSGGTANIFQRADLTNSTTVTIQTNSAASLACKYNFAAVEFISGVITSLQRGTITLTGATSNTATISAVTTANSLVNSLHFTATQTTANIPNVASRVSLTNTTTVTVNKNAGTNNTTLSYEVADFTQAAGIAFDAASNSGYQAASSGYTWSHTCTGSDRYLTVGIAMLSLAQTVTGITYNSVAMTFLGAQNSVSGAARVELWGLIAPSTGSNTISVTLSGSIASAGCASSYTGVHQSVPTEAFNSAQATNVGAADATVNVTTVADNDWVVDMVATDDTAITVGSGNTSRGNVTGVGGSGAMGDNNAAKTPAGSVTMSWTNVGALATWSIAAIALRPIAASGGSVFTPYFYQQLIGGHYV